MELLTDEDLRQLEDVQTGAQWATRCLEIKARRRGTYPQDCARGR